MNNSANTRTKKTNKEYSKHSNTEQTYTRKTTTDRRHSTTPHGTGIKKPLNYSSNTEPTYTPPTPTDGRLNKQHDNLDSANSPSSLQIACIRPCSYGPRRRRKTMEAKTSCGPQD